MVRDHEGKRERDHFEWDNWSQCSQRIWVRRRKREKEREIPVECENGPQWSEIMRVKERDHVEWDN